MPLKASGKIHELCYPFIHEASSLCDYEVITDELCTQIGMAVSASEPDFPELAKTLADIQPLAFHLNGSVRGKLAISEIDIERVTAIYHHYCELAAPLPQEFILPRGTAPVPQLHACRSNAKKAIRALVRVDGEGKTVNPLLPRLLNLLCNLFFIMTLWVNRERELTEIPFKSLSY